MRMVFLSLLSLRMLVLALTKWRWAAAPSRLKLRAAAFLMIAASGLFVQEAQAAFVLGGATCTAQSKAAGTSLACTVATENLDAGNVAVLWFAGDNVATTDVTTALLTSVTDSVGGNTWTVRQCFTNGQGTAATGATTCVATSVLTNTLAIGSTITANFTSITAKAMVVREFTIAAGNTIAVAGTIQTLANDNADPGAMTVGGLIIAQYLWVRSTALERANAAWTATASHTTSGCNGTTGAGPASNMNICGEFRILTGTTDTSDPTATAVDNASLFMAFREVPMTTIADGTNPSNVTIAPSAAITDLDAFTLATDTGTDSITALTVTLTGANSFESLSEVRITSNDNATTYFSAVANPASNTVSFSGGTAIPVTTTTTTFKARITPKTHANMPVPPGLSYAVGGTVTAFTGTNVQSGTDSASATVTIDNLSPANVTGASCTAGNGQVSLSWTNPADSDFHSTVVLRNTVAVADTPVEGTTYVVSDTIGTSTVACVVATPTATCTDTVLTNGTAYHYRIFARDTNVNYSATGVVPSSSPCTPTAVSSFNVVETGANAVTGLTFTKIAGQNISVDIVALDASNAIVTGFTDTVAVELVDNSGGGACESLPLIKTLTNQTFIGGDNGRHPLSAGQFEAEARRNVKFRIKYPTVSPTVTSCSTDAFANRPLQFVNVLVRDLNRTTAGTTNTLNNTSNPGTGTVHNAGRPFQIDATAQNGAGPPATTTNYTLIGGQPVVVLTQCGVPAVCPTTPGTLTPGTFSAASGVITTTTATYNDVGAFDMVLQDQTFASVDAGDGTATSVRYISSSALTVGRFVPDYFTLEAGSSITPRSDIVACAGSSFTYMDEKMDLVFTLKAREFSGGAVTPSYSGATLGALVLNSAASYSFGAIDTAAPTPLTARLDLSQIAGVTATWSAGEAIVTAAPLAITRAASPDGPYASLKLGIAPSDPDTVTLRAADLNLDADNSGTPERAEVGAATPTAARFGRLRLQNALGSEKLDLPIPLQAQYWTGTVFATNSADSCTSLSAANLPFSAYTGGITMGNMNIGNISLGGAFTSGVGSLKLTKPLPAPASPGSTTLTVNLTVEAKSYLKGNWGVPTYTANPSSRAAFGLFGSQPRNFIFFRENY